MRLRLMMASTALAATMLPAASYAWPTIRTPWSEQDQTTNRRSGGTNRGDDNTSISGSYQSGNQRVPRVDSPEDRKRIEAARQRRQQEAQKGDPDVLLDVPNISVDKIDLEVDNVQANLALDARVANLVKLTAGVDLKIGKVKLTIEGVRAEALLKVRLDNVREILDRTLTTIDRNPALVERLLQSVDNTVGTVGDLGGKALDTLAPTLENLTRPDGLLSQTVNTLGQSVFRVVDRTGNIVEHTLDTAGKAVGQGKILGNVLNLEKVSESTNAQGQTVRRVRDTSGAVVELVLDQAGKLLSSKVVSAAPKTGG